MVTMSTLDINQHRYICITLQLPRLTTRLIYCTHGILFDDCWNLNVLKHRCKVPVCIGQGRSVEALLENELLACSTLASKAGIIIGMKGQQALLKMMDEN